MSTRYLMALVLGLCFLSPVAADQVLFTNVNVFDGVSDSLKNHDVLVEGNMIRQVGASIEAPGGTTVIDGGGRTLMPGIIEGHGHLMLSMDATSWFNTHDVFYIGAAAAQEAENYLMRGWTTVRDIGGPVEGLHRAIEDGRIIGPRIYGSNAVVGQTSGHGDFRQHNDPHPNTVEYKQPFYCLLYTSDAADE